MALVKIGRECMNWNYFWMILTIKLHKLGKKCETSVSFDLMKYKPFSFRLLFDFRFRLTRRQIFSLSAMVNLSKANFKVNNPLPTDLASQIKKCTTIINGFIKPEKGQPIDKVIPANILANAKGLAILTVVKAGFLVSGRAGSGLLIAKSDLLI